MTERVPVAIVGGGPTGLSAAILLARFGIGCRLFEQASGLSDHPKARGIRVRTMELFRQWGLESELRARALPLDALRFIYCETLAGEEIARTDDLEPGAFAASPTTSCRVAQDEVAAMLLSKAQSEPTIQLLSGTRVVGVAQSDAGVTVTTDQGESYEHDYLVAADGAGSTVREALGIGRTGKEVLSWWQSVYWRGDLERWTAGRQCIQFITGAATGQQVQIASVDGRQRWVTLIALPPSSDRPPDLPEQDAKDAIRRAVGDRELDISIVDIATFRVSALNASRYREGRVFLAGDSAHVLPPTGGMGMNTGIQDVHNLAWKLAFVLKDWADDRLLDTYDTERRSVAATNIQWSLENSQRFRELRSCLAEGDSRRAAVLLAELRDAVTALGQDLGFVYASGCVVGDGTPAPAPDPARYDPQARPGHRAPAVWLHSRKLSTIDLYDRELTLLVGAQGGAWRADQPLRANLKVVQIGVDPLVGAETDLHSAYGITPVGAVLVRPDGHVAWRAASLVEDRAATLGAVLKSLALQPREFAGAAA